MRENFHLSKSPLIEVTFYCEGIGNPINSKELATEYAKCVIPDYENVRLFPSRMLTTRRFLSSEQDESFAVVGERRIARRGVRFKQGFFSFSLLGSYPGWDVFVSEATDIYMRYVSCLKVGRVKRIGVRSVNRFLPLRVDQHPSSILNELPGPRDGLDAEIIDFVNKDTQYYPDRDLYSAVIQSMKTRGVDDGVMRQVFLDLDVFALDKNGMPIDAVGEVLSKVHKLKDDLFFGLVRESVLQSLR